jgi:hypothetical protein
MSRRDEFLKASKDRIVELEHRLSGVLQPIHPRQEFVKGLRQRIDVLHKPSVVGHLSFFQFLFVVLAGVFSATILMVMGTRALLSLLTALGILETTRQKRPARVSSEF